MRRASVKAGEPDGRMAVTLTGEQSPAARIGPRLDVKALVAFFVLAYVLSWSWVLPLAAAHQVVHRGAGWPTHYPALFGPAIAAIVVTAWTVGRPGSTTCCRGWAGGVSGCGGGWRP